MIQRKSIAEGNGSIQSQLDDALKIDWSRFNWGSDCSSVHEGSMKVVGNLKSHPGVAVVSVLAGTGDPLIQNEINTLSSLAAHGIRTIKFARQVLDVPHFDSSQGGTAKGYLVEYFSANKAFLYEEGEPGTEDHFLEPMRKLRILAGDEGDWTMNRDTIRVLKENSLEKEFMEDMTAYVKLFRSKGVRIVDFQGILGKDGHFYIADPLRFEPIGAKVNKNLLEGVFMTSRSPARENKPSRAAFVQGLGVELGVTVPDEE